MQDTTEVMLLYILYINYILIFIVLLPFLPVQRYMYRYGTVPVPDYLVCRDTRTGITRYTGYWESISGIWDTARGIPGGYRIPINPWV